MKARHRDLFQMSPPDGCGRCTGECGDSIEVQLCLQGDHIDRVAFRCDGCLSTTVAATAVTALVRGAPLREALLLTAPMVIDHIGDLDEENEHCAVIAVNALHSAVTDALRNRTEPWKRLYRT
jgi:nitrogen fixation NifU-like protein